MSDSDPNSPLYRTIIEDWCRRVDDFPAPNTPQDGPLYFQLAAAEERKFVTAVTMLREEAYSIIENGTPVTIARLPEAVMDSAGAVYPAPGVVLFDERSMWPVLPSDPMDRNAPPNENLEAPKAGDRTWPLQGMDNMSGPAILMGQASHENFNSWYHFLLDFVPRFMVLERFQELAEVPVILPHPLTKMHRQVFDIMGFDADRFLIVPENGICVKNAFVPSFTGPWSGITKQASDWIVNRFQPVLADPSERVEKIYLTRGTGTRRQVANEEELTALLEKVGFRVVAPGEMPVAEQARTLSKAIFVVGVHGAAMTNLLFCSPGCRVIELYPALIEEHMFVSAMLQSLTGVRGLFHGVMFGESPDRDGNFIVDPGELMRFLQIMANFDPGRPLEPQGLKCVKPHVRNSFRTSSTH